MAGYTDVGFRRLCKKYGAALTYTEMISAKALCYNNKKTIDLLSTFEGESPIAVQLFGSQPQDFEQAIKSGLLDKFDIIDINMGCPAPKIFNNGEGSALMADTKRAVSIVKACVAATDKPITVKFRSGIDENSISAVSFAKAMEKAGVSLITIHARTTKQGYSGKADLELARQVKDAVSIPVIVSGDCVSKESFEHILNVTKADGVMIGRASLGRPEIFSEIREIDREVNKQQDILEHINELRKHFSERYVVLNMRSHLAFYLKKYKIDIALRQKLLSIVSLEELKSIIKQVF